MKEIDERRELIYHNVMTVEDEEMSSFARRAILTHEEGGVVSMGQRLIHGG